jgi:cell division septal protein FtsQ
MERRRAQQTSWEGAALVIRRDARLRPILGPAGSDGRLVSARGHEVGTVADALERRRNAGLFIGRVMALVGLIASSGLMYHVAFSPQYQLREVRTSGNSLATASEIEAAVREIGSEAFWIQTGAVRRRVLAIPAIAEADVRVVLPDRLEVRVRERPPFGVLQTGATAQLLDVDGVVIGSTSQAPPILTIRNLDASLEPPVRFDPEAFGAVKVLSKHLGGTAFEPTTFAYSRQTGLEFETREGIVVRLGDGRELEWKLGALDKMRQYLVEHQLKAQLIDVRFRDRPYFR